MRRAGAEFQRVFSQQPLPERAQAAAGPVGARPGSRRSWTLASGSRRLAAAVAVAAVALGSLAACGGTTATSPTAAASPTVSGFPAGSYISGLYAVNGHRLYLTCAGAGHPTIVLESGLTSDHTQWDPVTQLAAEVGVQVCAYDRYGLGMSDTPPTLQTRTIDQAVADVHALLGAAHLPGPYVLAGTSMGGLIDREFARLYPGDVVGMVLLDSAPDDWDVYTGTETFTEQDESFDVQAASEALRASDDLGSEPLVVVQAGDDSSVQAGWAPGKTDFQTYWTSRQLALAGLSTNSILVLAPSVSHDYIATLPAGLSAAAMRLVAVSVHTGAPLPGCAQTALPGLGATCLGGAR